MYVELEVAEDGGGVSNGVHTAKVKQLARAPFQLSFTQLIGALSPVNHRGLHQGCLSCRCVYYQ